MKCCVPLEPQTEAVCQASSKPPLIFGLPVAQRKMVLGEIQDNPVCKYPAQVKRVIVNTGRWDAIPVYLVEPETVYVPADVILYIHDAGWMFSSYHTHGKLVRELAARTGSLLIFPGYSHSPKVQYPTAIEQCYSMMCMVPELVRNMEYTANLGTFTVAGDSVGGNVTTAPALMSKFRRGPTIQEQLLYYPVTNTCFNTGLYCEFIQGYYLYRAGMEWSWNQYIISQRDRNQVTASPPRANLEQLGDLPDIMILNGEAGVLRGEGEVYVIKLRQAGVGVTTVRFQAIIHDFMMLNSLDRTKICRAAMDVSAEWINRKNVEK